MCRQHSRKLFPQMTFSSTARGEPFRELLTSCPLGHHPMCPLSSTPPSLSPAPASRHHTFLVCCLPCNPHYCSFNSGTHCCIVLLLYTNIVCFFTVLVLAAMLAHNFGGMAATLCRRVTPPVDQHRAKVNRTRPAVRGPRTLL